MKNKLYLLLGLAVLIVTGCADGKTPATPEPSPSGSCDVIVQAYKSGGDPSSAAADLQITSGDSVVITWSGNGMTGATLVSDPAEVVGPAVTLTLTEKEVEENGAKSTIKVLEGSQEFRALDKDVSFSVKGVNAEKDKSPTECEGHANIKVAAAPEQLVINKFEANNANLTQGQSTEICWEVVPTTATVSIADDKGNILSPVVESSALKVMTAGLGKADSTSSTVAATFTATGCTTVSPTETVTYTLTANTADGQTETKALTVNVAAVALQVSSFKVNGQENLILSSPGSVNLAWEVTPSDAVVTVDQGIGEVEAVGSKSVDVKENTVFTLSASYDGQTAAKQVSVNIQQGGGSGIQLNANLTASSKDVFAGEEVTLNWEITTADGSAIPEGLKVTLNTLGEKQDVTGTSAVVKPLASGTYEVEVSGNGIYVKSNSLTITVRQWTLQSSGEWVSVETVDAAQSVFFGKRAALATVKSGDSVAGGTIGFGKIVGSKGLENGQIDFGALFRSLFNAANKADDWLAPFGPYSVVFSLDGNRLYSSTTGGIVYSDDVGSNWNILDVFPAYQGNPEKPSCRGFTQTGDKTQSQGLDNLIQICDVVGVDGALVAATDYGTFSLASVEKRITDRGNKENCWQGVPDNKCSTTNALTGVVSHVLIANADKVYVGTDKGVYVSSDKGISWTDLNGGDLSSSTAIYAFAIDASSETPKLYAGGVDGIYVADLSANSWKKLSLTDGGTVYSIAVDPVNSGTVFAGTEKGVFVSHNSGETWADISRSMGTTGKVYGIGFSKNEAVVGVYMATSTGAYSSVATSPSLVLEKTNSATKIEETNAIKSLKTMIGL